MRGPPRNDRLAVLGVAAILAACSPHGRASRPSTIATPAPVMPPIAVVAPEAPAAPETARSPVVAPASSARPPPRPGAYANDDPDDDLVVGPPDVRPTCEADLAAAGVKVAPATLPVHVAPKSKITCGAPQVVVYVRGPGKIAYSSSPLLTCTMALALAQWETIVQEEAQRSFGSRVARIDHLGTYSCREIAAYPGWVSEHSYANAIDIGAFTLQNGRTIEVLRDFDLGEEEPKKAAGRFLRAVSRRANDEDVFSHVLTPFFDSIHKNHFHLDLSRFRSDGTRPQTD
ncbi:MAG: extensin family protein [Deltaproteobacteria bacterium]|nr:extensin family protein [Deltaproteobacteria bacterium]